MVLHNEGIIEALKNGDIRITKYKWNSRFVEEKFDPTSLKEGHKIRLHVGFLLRTLSDKRWLNPKKLYNKRDGIVDLRKMEEGKYILQPKESVLIYTNEVIKLGEKYFGFVLSRVSLEESGLIVSPSYIDPKWEGVLQLVVTNNSETPKILKEHCEIANLILIKMEQPAKGTTTEKNDHYGVTWELISDNPMYPKWHDRKRAWWLKVRHGMRTYWALVTGVGGVGLVAIIYQLITIIMNLVK